MSLNVSTRPPTRFRASSTTTLYPTLFNSYAHASPANPPPITTTRLPFADVDDCSGLLPEQLLKSIPPEAASAPFSTSRREIARTFGSYRRANRAYIDCDIAFLPEMSCRDREKYTDVRNLRRKKRIVGDPSRGRRRMTRHGRIARLLRR